MSGYEQINDLINKARKKARRLKHNSGKVNSLRNQIDILRTKDRKKLLKNVKKLYSYFDAKYADLEIDYYLAILKIAGAYSRDKQDKNLIAIDRDYLDRFRKNIDRLKSAYLSLADTIVKRPLDQEDIDIGINSIFNYIDWIEGYRFEEMRAEIITRVDAAEIKAERQGLNLMQRAVMMAACVVIGIGTVTADFSVRNGFAGFGGSAAAGEVQKQNFYWIDEYYNQATPRDDIMKGMREIKIGTQYFLIKNRTIKNPVKFKENSFNKYYFSDDFGPKINDIFNRYGVDTNALTKFLQKHNGKNDIVSLYQDGFMILHDHKIEMNYLLEINQGIVDEIYKL